MLSGVFRTETDAVVLRLPHFSCSVVEMDMQRTWGFVLTVSVRTFPGPAESSELVPGHNRSLSAASWDQNGMAGAQDILRRSTKPVALFWESKCKQNKTSRLVDFIFLFVFPS